MPTPAVIRGSDQFFVTTYEGNGGGQKVGKFVPFTDSGTIAKSAIFENGGPAYLDKTYGSAGTSLKKFTFSCWFKIGADTIAGTSGYFPTLFNVGGESGKYFSMFIQSQYQNIQLYSYNSGYDLRKITNRTFEDTTKWYHIVCAIDTTESTGSDRVKLYIDGDRITSFSTSVDPSQDYDLSVGAAEPYYVGFMNSGDTWDGYMAEVNYVDGTALTPSTFGLTDTSTGRWIPKTLTGITYGSNGFRMQFANSAGQTIGDDTSGNTNDFTVNNMVAADISTDSPTQNFTTLEPGNSGSMTLTEGNLRYTTASSSNWESVYSDKSINTGKWYFEVTCKVTTAYDAQPGVILESVMTANKNQLMGYTDGSVGYNMDGSQNTLYYGNSGNNYLVHGATDASTAGVVIGVAYDADTGAMWFAKNNTWVNNGTGAGDPSAGTNATFVEPQFAKQNVRFGFSTYNASASYEINFGAKDFNYTPPTDFKKVQQDNLPDDGKGLSDLVWIKNRDASDSHQLYDSTRGPRQDLNPDATNAEGTTTDGLQKFLKGGCQIEDDVSINTTGESYVSWNWVANGGTTSANTDGSGATIASTIQANQTAGFSIVTYTGNGTQGAKVAHGLSQAPEWILIKVLTNHNWQVYHVGIGAEKSAQLDVTTAPTDNAGYFNDTAPTSSVFSVGANTYRTNDSSSSHVAYCWHSVEGFSKFGRYAGNGSADGTFIYLGFKPSWLMIKRTDSSTGGNWSIIDNTRYIANPIGAPLLADTTDAESGLSSITMDLLSNGFKIRNTLNSNNNSSGTYVYMAFAEHPFVGNGTNPVTAR